MKSAVAMQEWRRANPDRNKANANRARVKARKRPGYHEAKRDYDRRYYAANPLRTLIRLAKKRAKAAGVPFDLYVFDLEIPARCPVLGITLTPGGGRGRMVDTSPSLDRIRPRLGYVPGNVLVVSWRANRLKGDATLDEIARIARFYKRA